MGPDERILMKRLRNRGLVRVKRADRGGEAADAAQGEPSTGD